jgi:hypothetical protein
MEKLDIYDFRLSIYDLLFFLLFSVISGICGFNLLLFEKTKPISVSPQQCQGSKNQFEKTNPIYGRAK